MNAFHSLTKDQIKILAATPYRFNSKDHFEGWIAGVEIPIKPYNQNDSGIIVNPNWIAAKFQLSVEEIR
jgi:hypothetical protein